MSVFRRIWLWVSHRVSSLISSTPIVSPGWAWLSQLSSTFWGCFQNEKACCSSLDQPIVSLSQESCPTWQLLIVLLQDKHIFYNHNWRRKFDNAMAYLEFVIFHDRALPDQNCTVVTKSLTKFMMPELSRQCKKPHVTSSQILFTFSDFIGIFHWEMKLIMQIVHKFLCHFISARTSWSGV